MLDRACHLRRDRGALHALLDNAQSHLVLMWRGKALLRPDGLAALFPTVAEAGRLLDAGEVVFLGLRGGSGYFAVDLANMDAPLEATPLAGQGSFEDLRMAGNVLPADEAGLLMYARAVLHFHRRHRYCGQCGVETAAREGGHLRECLGCQERFFPRTDPAVMILIERDGSCLLARQPAFPQGMYSVLAGFVEPGETLEQAVLRETHEEVGLALTDVRYLASQPWPFPASLMIGFGGRAETTQIHLDREELEDGRWFSREELREPDGFFIPPPFSLAHRLIHGFIRG